MDRSFLRASCPLGAPAANPASFSAKYEAPEKNAFVKDVNSNFASCRWSAAAYSPACA